MPLSKARNRERMRQIRLHERLKRASVQPIDAVSLSVKREGYGKASSTVIPELDADGNPIYEEN